MLLTLLLQAAPVTSASAAPPPSFSILYRPCAPVAGKDVVVCGRNQAESDRLPMPRDAPPTPGYVKPDSGDYRDNNGGAAPCATQIGGCPVLTDAPLVYKAIGAGIHAIGDAAKDRRWARARAADGNRRQAIDLSEAAPAGRVVP